MRIIAKRTLKRFWEQPGHGDAEGPLKAWHEEIQKADWPNPQALKAQYSKASICGNNRAVFDIGGNKYRLIVEVQYQARIVWVKFIGSHLQYDDIDVETVNEH